MGIWSNIKSFFTEDAPAPSRTSAPTTEVVPVKKKPTTSPKKATKATKAPAAAKAAPKAAKTTKVEKKVTTKVTAKAKKA